jgi:hypothetical protein
MMVHACRRQHSQFFFLQNGPQTEVERALLPSHITLKKKSEKVLYCLQMMKERKKERACTVHYEDKIGIC